MTQRVWQSWCRECTTGSFASNGRSPYMVQSASRNVSHLLRKVTNRPPSPSFLMIVVARKIRYRADSAIKIQKQVRMYLALRKHRPRYQSIRALRALQDRVQTLTALGEPVVQGVVHLSIWLITNAYSSS